MSERDPVDLEKRTTLRRFAAVGAMSPFAGLLEPAAADDSGGAGAGAGDETRGAILGYLATTPGAHFSKIRDDLGLGTGETQYHVRQLLDRGVIESYTDGEYRRFVPVGRFSEFERRVLGHLRRDTARGVIIGLLERPETTGRELAERVGVSPATISRTVADLESAGVLDREDGDRLREPETVITLLVRYAESFDRETEVFAARADELIRYAPK